jgi:hypothetical protein
VKAPKGFFFRSGVCCVVNEVLALPDPSPSPGFRRWRRVPNVRGISLLEASVRSSA